MAELRGDIIPDKIDVAKIMDRADLLAKFTSMRTGLKRIYLSKEHQQAHQQMASWMQSAGLSTWQDSVGNQWGRKVAMKPTLPTLIIGSHSDTVANAGKYDGNLGILLGISAMEALMHVELPFHVDIVAFADEEGTRFDTTLIGSSAAAGVFQDQWLAIEGRDGISMADAMLDFGLSPEKAGHDSRSPEEVMAYLEVHIEQGPVLEAADCPVGVVTGIAGAKRYQFIVKGMAGHAGTVPHNMRSDALCGVAEMMSAVEHYAQEHSVVATVGKCDVISGSVNVIPGEVHFTLDIRSLEQAKLERGCDDLFIQLSAIAEKRGLDLQSQLLYQAEAVHCCPSLQQQWGAVVNDCVEGEPIFLASGAGHDALAMDHICRTGMLFVRCEKGISHNPLEAVTPYDVSVALNCLTKMILAQKEAVLDAY